MRHKKSGRQFSRNTSHRRAMLRALTANLVAHERIETTEAKAKELRRVAERLITRARRLGPIAYTPQSKLSLADQARRQAAQQQMSRFLRRFAVVRKGGADQKIDLVEKVFTDLAKRFKDRPGGYTRIMKLGPRRGDNAPMTLIELVDRDEAPKAESEPKVAKPAAAKESKPAEAKQSKPADKAEPAKAKAEAKKTESKADKAEGKGEEAEKAPAKPKKAAKPKKTEE